MKFERCPDCGLMYDRHVRGHFCPHCPGKGVGIRAFFIAIVILTLALLLCSCNRKIKGDDVFNTFSVIELDGCEYVVYSGYKKGGITHKGNCKNHEKI